MFGLFRKKDSRFERKILRKNDISILILDERWNSLFKDSEMTSEIKKCEEKIREFMKEEARLKEEVKNMSLQKKQHLTKIMSLTKEAFENGNENAREEMKKCEAEVKKINDKILKTEKRLEVIPDDVKDSNLELLEHTVNSVYFKIRSNQKKVEELDKIIEETREKLKNYVDERQSLAQDYTDVYAYFHNLLGSEELEKLDKEHFG